MLKLSIRALLQNKIRYGITAFAVLLGVSSVVASFVIADSLRKVFEGVGADIGDPIAVQVRAEDPFGRDVSIDQERPPVPAALVDLLRDVDGAEKVNGDVFRFVAITTEDGTRVEALGGAPIIAVNWEGPENSSTALELLEGAAPTGQQTSIDIDTAEKYDIAVGQSLTITAVGGPEEFEVSGIMRFGENNGGGAIYTALDTPTAQRFLDSEGQFDTISMGAVDGVTPTELLNRVSEALPDGFEAVTGQQVGDEFADSFGQIISIIRSGLLGFAGVTLFVAAFIIANTFQIVIGQRTRELAMLRAIGANRNQVFRSVLTEAAITGLIGSVIGIVVGVGLARVFLAFVASQGGSFPAVPLVLSPTTWIIALAVGMIVTLLAAVAPAWRAGRTPPMAAMREGLVEAPRSRIRTIIGAAAVALGAVMMAGALFGNPPSTAALFVLLAVGAIGIFLGVARLTTFFAAPVVGVLGRRWFAVVVLVLAALLGLGAAGTLVVSVASGNPAAIVFGVLGAAVIAMLALALYRTGRGGLGLPGTLGRSNAARNPQRTSATASALMIGLALVGLAAVLGQSLKDSFASQLGDTITADYFFSQDSFTGFSPELSNELEALPEIDTVSFFRQGAMRVADKTKTVSAVDAAGIDGVLKYTFVAGGWDGLEPNGLVVNEDVAEDLAVSVGDTVDVDFVISGQQSLTIVGVFDSRESFGRLGNWIIGRDTFAENFGGQFNVDLFGGATRTAGVSEEAAAAAINGVIEQYPEVDFADRVEFKANQESDIDQLLVIINALLVFALLIALLGIGNTMALSVIERTRELGLLRAVGASRDQVRAMVRWESIVVSTFGAVLGIILGVGFGLTIVSAIPSAVITETSVPVGTLVQLLLVGIIAGLVASLWPARRAARLNVLDAISH